MGKRRSSLTARIISSITRKTKRRSIVYQLMPRGDQGLNMTAISSGVLKTQVVSFFFAFFPLASLSFGDEISLEWGRELAQRFLVVDTHIDFPFRLLEQSAKSAKPRTGPQVKPSFNPASRETL